MRSTGPTTRLSPRLGWRLAAPLGLCLLLACTLAGCGPEPVHIGAGARSYQPDDYLKVQRLWTRDSRLNTLAEMDNVLTVTSTYESSDFRRAYVTRYAEDYRLTAAERASLMSRSMAEAEASETFYVALFAQNTKYSDLNLQDAAWIVRLVDENGTETAPLSVAAIRRPSAVELTYFPYTSSWRTVYRITFPRQTSGGRAIVRSDSNWFGLRFAGPKGQTTLVWQVAH